MNARLLVQMLLVGLGASPASAGDKVFVRADVGERVCMNVEVEQGRWAYFGSEFSKPTASPTPDKPFGAELDMSSRQLALEPSGPTIGIGLDSEGSVRLGASGSKNLDDGRYRLCVNRGYEIAGAGQAGFSIQVTKVSGEAEAKNQDSAFLFRGAAAADKNEN